MGREPSDTIAVLGAGSWGTALAIVLARNGRRVRLWGHAPEHLSALARERRNRTFLPEVAFPQTLEVCADLKAAVEGGHALIVVPSHAFRAVLTQIKPHLHAGNILAWATKGIEPGSAQLLSEVVRTVLGEQTPTGVISGPSFATEVAAGLPVALTTAAQDLATAQAIAQWLRNAHVRVYPGTDLVGVQIGGAVKNVMAIAAGISDGLGFGANARAALITRGLAEITRLGMALGGARETFMGLAGMGDLVLTCTDDQSRNRRLGLALAQGRKSAEFLAQLGQVAEGVGTTREIYLLAQRLQVDMPITEQVYRVLFEECPPRAAVQALLSREARPE